MLCAEPRLRGASAPTRPLPAAATAPAAQPSPHMAPTLAHLTACPHLFRHVCSEALLSGDAPLPHPRRPAPR